MTRQPCNRVPGDWRRPDVKASYEIVWNDDATYGQVVPRPTATDIPAFYDFEDYYTHQSSCPGDATQISFLDRALRNLAWRVDRGVEPTPDWWRRVLGAEPKRILEIGCGDGSNLTMLRAMGHEVVGVEPDPKARESTINAGIEVHDGAGEAIPAAISDRRFDAVLLMHVLEHCLDPAEVMNNIRRMLVPSGLCVAETPNNECLGATVFGAAWYWLDVPRHLNFFTTSSLREEFKHAAFEVKDVLYRGYVRQFSAPWIEAQRTIAHRLEMPVPGRMVYWRYLAQTAFASSAQRYDSVRIIGRIKKY